MPLPAGVLQHLVPRTRAAHLVTTAAADAADSAGARCHDNSSSGEEEIRKAAAGSGDDAGYAGLMTETGTDSQVSQRWTAGSALSAMARVGGTP